VLRYMDKQKGIAENSSAFWFGSAILGAYVLGCAAALPFGLVHGFGHLPCAGKF
jgi:hypothetical protein